MSIDLRPWAGSRVACVVLALVVTLGGGLASAGAAGGPTAGAIANAVVRNYRTAVAGTTAELSGDIFLCVKGTTSSTITGAPSVLDPKHRSCYRQAHQHDTSVLSGGAELGLDEVTTAPGMPSLEFLSERASRSAPLATYMRLSTASCWSRVLVGGGSLPDQFVSYGGEHLSIAARHGTTVDLKGTASSHGSRYTEHDIIDTTTDLISRIDSLTIGPGANRLRLVTRFQPLRAAPTLPDPTPLCGAGS
ncbi:MAG TPA: hypothetical protein VG165_14815 [Solirubrobacteraceae bacterium]|nr:hypothetical protein [Solirubrobacteraceae bacterium]